MLEKVKQAVLAGDTSAAAQHVRDALADGVEPARILNTALIPAMDVVGREYESGLRYIPEMLISAEAMKSAMEVLRPRLADAGVELRARVIVGTVEGDLHDIGKNLVSMMLEGAGYEVIDLGVQVTADEFADAVRSHKPQIVALSALLTTTMVHMRDVVQALDSEGVHDDIYILIGGAPVTQEYADEIGADGYAMDAAGAVRLANKLIGSAPTARPHEDTHRNK
jgi:5-methyltetrahydrofolate--homocysteine methyltransferase